VADGRETVRAVATVTLDARALDELGPETMDRLADLVEARLLKRRAAGEERLLTASAAAEIAGVHAETVRRAIRAGAIEVAGYVGGRPRVRRAAVEAWVARGEGPAPASSAPRVVRGRRQRAYPRILGEALREERAA
jgi:excisionase family DNA binding protein